MTSVPKVNRVGSLSYHSTPYVPKEVSPNHFCICILLFFVYLCTTRSPFFLFYFLFDLRIGVPFDARHPSDSFEARKSCLPQQSRWANVVKLFTQHGSTKLASLSSQMDSTSRFVLSRQNGEKTTANKTKYGMIIQLFLLLIKLIILEKEVVSYLWRFYARKSLSSFVCARDEKFLMFLMDWYTVDEI